MTVVTVFVCFALFFANIAITAYRAKEYLSEEKSTIGKILVIADCAIAILGCAFVALKIDLGKGEVLAPLDTNGIGTLVYLLTLWAILSILSGGILAVVIGAVAVAFSVVKDGEAAIGRRAKTPGAEAGAEIAMRVGGVILSFATALMSLQELIARNSII